MQFDHSDSTIIGKQIKWHLNMAIKNNYLYHNQSASIVDHLLTDTDDLESLNQQQGR